MSPWRTLLDLVYPPTCLGCGVPARDADFCADCWSRIPRWSPPACRCCGIPFLRAAIVDYDCSRCTRRRPAFRRTRALAVYRRAGAAIEPLPAAIQRFKYGRDVTLARGLGRLLAASVAGLGAGEYDAVVPVPLHRERLRWRGFNQSLLLARHLAARLDAPVVAHALRRTRSTDPQVDLDESARRVNVAGAFTVVRNHGFHEARVLLVDDVMTSGATVDECARALVRSGAAHVDVHVLARAVPQ